MCRNAGWLRWGLLSLVFVMILAACGAPSPAVEPEPDATEEEAAADEEEAAADEEEAAADEEETAADEEEAAAEANDEPLVVVATTGHIADTLTNLGGGDLFEVQNLLGPGIDPHTYVPTESDIELFETADIIFYNGVRLEAQMDELLEQIGERGETVVVGVGDGLPEDQLLDWEPENNLPYDPHIWNDMQLWMETTQTMADTLAEADPAHADEYATLNEAYQAQLQETHEYVQTVAESIPEANRIIISGHDAFNYFGRTYGFQVEAVQGVSTETEASAADIQNLVDLIVENEVPAIFIENIVAPDTIEAVQAGAQAEGVDVEIGGELYSDALGEEGSEGETYIGLMRYNIDTIAGALGGTPGVDSATSDTADADAADTTGEQLVVVATTGHIADTLTNLGGGDLFEVQNLLGPGIDPHTYVPIESDIELFETADIIFYNGVRLEAQMDELLEQIGERGETVVVGVGDGLPEDQLLDWEPENNLPYDPHIWNDMQLWMKVTQTMADTLAEADPAHADEYATLNEAYQAQLQETHEYVQTVAESIPEANRIIISGHDAFNYFGRTYGFQVEAVQGVSTETEASAADIQNLVDLIVENEVPAIFIENIVAPDTIEAVQAGAQAEGVDVEIGGELYSDALGEEGSEGETYIGLMRYNIDTIAGALGGTPGVDSAASDTDTSAEEIADEEAAAETSSFEPVGSPVVNVYSARHYGAVEEVMERFTAETGIEVLISQGSTQSLVERILAEGAQTPADAIITIDGGSMQLLADEGVLATVDSEIIEEAIPENLRDPDGQWVGLSQRVRTLVYNPANVSEDETPTTYADLADPQWQERLCLRPASHIYTIALVASIIANEGEAEAERIVSGWVANNPVYINSDTRILETLEAGGCDAGITNHYYLGRILDENPDFPIEIVWANQETSGVHRNVVAMGVLESGHNQENAITLMEWLATEGQGAASDTLPGGNHEFPANPDADIHPVIVEFDEWEVDPLPIAEYGNNQATALQLLEQAGYGFDESVANN